MFKKRPIHNDLFFADDYHCNLSNELLTIAKRDLREDNISRTMALNSLRQWIQSQPDIKCRLDSCFLLRFLRIKKFSMPQAQEILSKYLVMRTLYPKWYHRLDIKDPALENLINKGFVFVLPERDLNGRRVIFGIINAVNSGKTLDSDTMRAMVMTFEALLEDEDSQIRGFTYIFESKGVGINAISIWSPTEFQRAFSTSEKAFPMRHKEVHFVHLPYIVSAAFQLFKSFLSEKLRNRMLAHSDMDSLKQIVPQRILPKEYGGEMPLTNMIELWKQELLQKRDKLLLLDHMSADIRKRKSKPKDMKRLLDGCLQNFRRLEID